VHFTVVRRDAFKALDRRARHQITAMHAHEALGEFFFEFAERFLHQMLALARAHGDVFQLRAQIQYLRHGYQMHPAALARRERAARGVAQLRQCFSLGRGLRAHLGQRFEQARGADGL